MLIRMLLGAGAVLLSAATGYGTTFSTTTVTADYYSNFGGFSNNGRLIVNNAYQTESPEFESLGFLKFDSSTIPLTFNSSLGDKAYFTLTKYGTTLTNSSNATPILIGISSLSGIDVASVTAAAGIGGLKSDISPNAQPALSPVVAQGWVGNNGVYSWDVTSLVQQWIDTPSSNRGIAIHARNDFAPFSSSLFNPYFVSSDGPDSAHVTSGYVAADALKPMLSSFIPGGSTLVPEPSACVLAFLASTLLLRARRRKL